MEDKIEPWREKAALFMLPLQRAHTKKNEAGSHGSPNRLELRRRPNGPAYVTSGRCSFFLSQIVVFSSSDTVKQQKVKRVIYVLLQWPHMTSLFNQDTEFLWPPSRNTGHSIHVLLTFPASDTGRRGLRDTGGW